MPRVGGPFTCITSQLAQAWFQCCFMRRKKEATLQMSFPCLRFPLPRDVMAQCDTCQGTVSSVTWRTARLLPDSYITPTRTLPLCTLPRLIPSSDARGLNSTSQPWLIQSACLALFSLHLTQHCVVLDRARLRSLAAKSC